MPYVDVTVEAGTLRGIDHAGVTSFLGVPYGASTAGDNRFRAPQPVTPWEGVRQALTFGPPAPQVDLRLSGSGEFSRMLALLEPRAASPTEGAQVDEDCLRLNVWTPSGRQDDALPVLVWLHGGGYTSGSGNEAAFHGDVLATAGELVVVTVTHRLGLLGFLDLRELGEPDSANAGMLDVVAALEWVQRNIRAFGGDPTRVTICGQSGGSGKVAMLNAMPRARDLFARSIMMSGPFGRAYRADRTAELRARVLELAGLTSVAALRAAPLERLLDAQAAVIREVSVLSRPDGTARFELDTLSGFGPALDPEVLPTDAFGDEATDGVRGKQLLVGWTSHDATFLLAADPSFGPGMSADDVAARIDPWASLDGVTYASLADRYPHEAPHLLYGRRMTWLMFEKAQRRIAALALAKDVRVWMYEFRQPTEVLDELLGATHSLELAYVFGTVDRIPLTGRSLDRHRVSRDMMQAWASFAHSGDPGWEPSPEAQNLHGFGTPYGPHSRLPESIDLSAALVGRESAQTQILGS